MRIAFFGWKKAFDYFQIGGAESLTRRIAHHLLQRGASVDFIFYAAEETKIIKINNNLILRYYEKLPDAFDAFEGNYDHVVTIYLFPTDRLKYAWFRKKHSKAIKFHFIYFGWPDSMFKRKLYFSEARLFPYNGKLFCLSARQYEYIKKWAKNAVYILPPVPEDYFLEPQEKPNNEKIKITFLGRIDLGKGINDVIELFEELKNKGRYELNIYGIYIPGDEKSFEIHQWLKNQKNIQYHEIDRQKYSPQVDDFVKEVLKETDIFMQPYFKLSSTIDTPLLLLEAMASLCAIITRPFGSIPDIYGESKFLIRENKNSYQDMINLLINISSDDIRAERERIYEQNKGLNFKTNQIAHQFINSLNV